MHLKRSRRQQEDKVRRSCIQKKKKKLEFLVPFPKVSDVIKYTKLSVGYTNNCIPNLITVALIITEIYAFIQTNQLKSVKDTLFSSNFSVSQLNSANRDSVLKNLMFSPYLIIVFQ